MCTHCLPFKHVKQKSILSKKRTKYRTQTDNNCKQTTVITKQTAEIAKQRAEITKQKADKRKQPTEIG